MSSSVAIEIKELAYQYKSQWLFKKIKALSNLNIEIFEGEAFGFLGPNGAGKTTTIKCILDLIRPSKGSIKILGKDSRLPFARSYVGYLPEQPYFYEHLNVKELMEMYAALSGVETKNIKSFVSEALDKVKIQDRSTSPMRTLSKGLTQRVAMAQAIVAKPKILILDEPFSGLDPIGRKEFKDLIIEQKALGTTILMSSHILSDVEFLCNRASILVKGELKGVCDLSKLQKTSSTSYELIIDSASESNFVEIADSIHKENNSLRMIFINRENANQALKKCQEMGIFVNSFNSLHAGLEEIFLNVVAGASDNSINRD